MPAASAASIRVVTCGRSGSQRGQERTSCGGGSPGRYAFTTASAARILHQVRVVPAAHLLFVFTPAAPVLRQRKAELPDVSPGLLQRERQAVEIFRQRAGVLGIGRGDLAAAFGTLQQKFRGGFFR